MKRTRCHTRSSGEAAVKAIQRVFTLDADRYGSLSGSKVVAEVPYTRESRVHYNRSTIRLLVIIKFRVVGVTLGTSVRTNRVMATVNRGFNRFLTPPALNTVSRGDSVLKRNFRCVDR